MQEDFEIYIKKADLDEVSNWLKTVFPVLEQQESANRKTHRFQAFWNEQPVPITVVEKAAKTDFTSIWFDTEHTPWSSDRECALAAFAFFQKPVRCNPEFWQEGDDPDLWLEIAADGEKNVIWQTEEN